MNFFIANAATLRCVSQSTPAWARAATASRSSARAAPPSTTTSPESAGSASSSASRERSCSTSSSPDSPASVAVSWSRVLCNSRRRWSTCRAAARSLTFAAAKRRGQLLLRRSVLRLNLERGRARRDARGHEAGNLDLGRGVRDRRPGLARRQRYPLVADDQFDIGGRDEFDCRRDQSEPAFGPVDRHGGLLDLPEQVVGDSDSRQLLRNLVPLALRRIYFREPGGQPLRLDAAGQLVDHAPGCVGALRCSDQKPVGLLHDAVGLDRDLMRRRLRFVGVAGFVFQRCDSRCARLVLGA